MPPTSAAAKAHQVAYRKQWVAKNRERVDRLRREYEAAHKDRYRDLRRKWREENIDKVRAANRARLLKKYGMTVSAYLDLLEKQNGRCGICGTAPMTGAILCVDHDHRTERVRGLLCVSCNLILGNAADNAQVLSKAIAYLRRVGAC